MFVTALILAAGSSRRLGEPKQLLPYRGTTLLNATIEQVLSFGLDQVLVTVGGAGTEVRDSLEPDGFEIVESVHHTDGCSSSIVSALSAVDERADGLLLFLGDQPNPSQTAVSQLSQAAARGAEAAVCSYRDGVGHPFWFSRAAFADLGQLHGDKAVWKVIESGRWTVEHVPIDAETPLDVDTREDYERLLADGCTDD